MRASDLIDVHRSRTLVGGGCPGPQGPPGPGVAPLYASFISKTIQPTIRNTLNPNSVAITYDERTIGTIDVSGAYPTSQILIPTSGT
jgi:hypothetical protein